MIEKPSVLPFARREEKITVQIPRIAIFPSAYIQMFKFAELAGSDEVSGMGKTIAIGDTLVITDIIYAGSNDSGGLTEITKQMSAYVDRLLKEGKAKEIQDVHLWWHSHVDGDVWWSGIDEATMARRITAKYLLAIVISKRFQYRARFYDFSPIVTYFDNIPINLWLEEGDEQTFGEATAEAKELWQQYHPESTIKRWFGLGGDKADHAQAPSPTIVIHTDAVKKDIGSEAQALADGKGGK